MEETSQEGSSRQEAAGDSFAAPRQEAAPEAPSHPRPLAPPPATSSSLTSTTPTHASHQFTSSLSYIMSKVNRQTASQTTPTAYVPSPALQPPQTKLNRQLDWGSKPPPDLASLPTTLSAPPLTLAPGTKRKRGDEDHTEDSAPVASPSVPPAAPAEEPLPPLVLEKPVLRKKKTSADAILRCEHCTRTTYSTTNPLVTCSECYESWHQHCHEPQIHPVIVAGKAPLRCSRCVGEEQKVREYERAKAEMEEREAAAAAYSSVDATRERNLEGLPEPPRTELVGFGAGSSTRDERVTYFSSLKRTDLINLLVFSDALQPGLLVDVLASIAKNHPDLPIFNHPEWAQGGERAPSPQPAGAHAKATTSLRRPTNKKHRVSAIRKVQDLAAAALGIPNNQEEEEFLPSQWPKVGQGLYAQLGPEEKDPWMYDDDDEEAFSHWIVGGDGKQIIPPVLMVGV